MIRTEEEADLNVSSSASMLSGRVSKALITNADLHPNAQNPYVSMVQSQSIHILDSFTLESGTTLCNVPVAYKTWGHLNSEGTNVMVICHAFSGTADVEDWWGPLLGPGKPFDPTKFFIFCGNVLGSPYGTASPCTLNYEHDPPSPYGPSFPLTTIRDDVTLHKAILDTLGVKEIQFVIGGSMGGMQVLEWAFLGSEYVKCIVPIATAGRHSAWCISWGEAQRQSIYSDPKYCNGYYYCTERGLGDVPGNGLSAARMAALLTYRSRNSFESRFGRKVMPSKQMTAEHPSTEAEIVHNEGHRVRLHGTDKESRPFEDKTGDTRFSVYSAQSYLRYQGDKFVKRFDANCYIAITRKLDTHDVSRNRGSFEDALSSISQPTLVIGIESDGLFTVDDQYELGAYIPNAIVHIIPSGEGHDGFLLEFEQIQRLLTDFMQTHCPPEILSSQVEGNFSAESNEMKTKKESVFGESEDLLLW